MPPKVTVSINKFLPEISWQMKLKSADGDYTCRYIVLESTIRLHLDASLIGDNGMPMAHEAGWQ